MARKTVEIPMELYERLNETLTDFENSTDDADDPEWMSDGEWLDEFFLFM